MNINKYNQLQRYFSIKAMTNQCPKIWALLKNHPKKKLIALTPSPL